jgi:hypothetical protein
MFRHRFPKLPERIGHVHVLQHSHLRCTFDKDKFWAVLADAGERSWRRSGNRRVAQYHFGHFLQAQFHQRGRLEGCKRMITTPALRFESLEAHKEHLR